GGRRARRLDPLDQVELGPDRRPRRGVEDALERGADARRIERLTVLETDTGTEGELPRPLVDGAVGRGQPGSQASVGVERDQGLADVAVDGCLDEAGL